MVSSLRLSLLEDGINRDEEGIIGTRAYHRNLARK